MFFSPFCIAITSLGEERANLGAFRAFVRFVFVWFCRFLFLLAAVCDSGNLWTSTFFFILKPDHWPRRTCRLNLFFLFLALTAILFS